MSLGIKQDSFLRLYLVINGADTCGGMKRMTYMAKYVSRVHVRTGNVAENQKSELKEVKMLHRATELVTVLWQFITTRNPSESFLCGSWDLFTVVTWSSSGLKLTLTSLQNGESDKKRNQIPVFLCVYVWPLFLFYVGVICSTLLVGGKKVKPSLGGAGAFLIRGSKFVFVKWRQLTNSARAEVKEKFLCCMKQKRQNV